ncbi:MAG: valine--tRNA ligase [Clostridia bacterium]|nr:valine--tRNA ligase [Clostridia bacterium]
MKQSLAKTYNPSLFADKIYQKWLDSGFFNPDNLDYDESAPVYTIILPPPNITAKLHLGHSSGLTIEDIMARYRRQQGYRVLWLPGTDHAAIATQNIVEKTILKETGKSRHDLGKEKFLEKVNSFVAKTQMTILDQTRRMGASLDWSRLAFTLDEDRQKAVQKMFIDMYEAGVIYRGERLVNWCPRCQSTLADDEVEYKEQKTTLYTFKYSQDCPIVISTTRPETKLGDTAIAVNPKDLRYQQDIAKVYKINFCGQNLVLPIITNYQVDQDFGTGALGVTPAHSIVDWQIGEENSLEVIKVIDEEAKILPGFGDYSGLSVEEARFKIVENLRSEGLMVNEEEIVNNLSCCYRCETAIEPLLSKQWFVAVDKPLERLGGKSMKEAAIELARTEEIKFLPARYNKRYQDWLENLHDWCISRQIWFGHSIPAWYKGQEIYVGEDAPKGGDWIKDNDTLDTWFSSGMWTFSTLGWPDNYKNNIKSGDLARFHPTQVLETGYEILTLWVSRMVMMSLFALGEKPFSLVYLHGIILDENGKKMSKSKGNGVDPIEVIEKYGADAVRLSLVMESTPGNDSRYSEDKIEAKRNFVNKLWNISRFILANVSDEALSISPGLNFTALTLADEWILQEMFQVQNKVQMAMDNSEFSNAADSLYEFTWNKLADWYLEIAKIEQGKDRLLVYILKNILIMWHPFIPYVTEAIWQSFNDSLLMVQQWPNRLTNNVDRNQITQFNDDFSFIQDLVIAIRNARSNNKISPAEKIRAIVYGEKAELILSQAEIVKGLKTGIKEVSIFQSKPEEGSIKIIMGATEIYLLVSIDPIKENIRLNREKEKLEKVISGLEKKLANNEFVLKAPSKLVQFEKNRLSQYRLELNKIEETLKIYRE